MNDREGNSAAVMDMTTGSAVRQIVRFSMPLVVGNLFQQLYSLVDGIVVGKFVSVEALAAVGCISWVCWMIGAFMRDCGSAFSIPASVAVGRQDPAQFRRIAGNMVPVCAFMGIFVTAAGLLAVPWILKILSVQDNVYDMARQYLIIYLLLIPTGLIYNILTSLLRALGDSRTTFISMTTATILNIILDFAFVIGLGAGVLGAGIATWISQAVSMVIALVAARREPAFGFSRQDMKPDPAILKELLRLWAPLFLNTLIITAGGVVVSHYANAIGSSFTAGISACTKIFGLMDAAMMAFTTGLGVYVGQNLGAARIDRVQSGLNRMVLFGIILGAVMIVAAQLVDQWVLPLFLSADNPETYERALQVATDCLRIEMFFMPVLAVMYFYRVSIQTLGHSIYAAAAGAVQMVVRIAVVLALPDVIGESAYFLQDGLAWLLCLPVVALPCVYYLRKLRAQQPPSAGETQTS